jgi:hypothetical protein
VLHRTGAQDLSEILREEHFFAAALGPEVRATAGRFALRHEFASVRPESTREQ